MPAELAQHSRRLDQLDVYAVLHDFQNHQCEHGLSEAG